MNTRRSTRGMTLVELVVAITIIATAAATMLGIMSTISHQSGASTTKAHATAIANAYMREIVAKSYAPVGGGGNRAAYNDVLDYAGLNNVGALDHRGSPVPGMAAYTVTVAVAAPANIFNPPVLARRITVTVTGPDNVRSVLQAYKTNHP
jgi:prepilin-type N-terminal cleavage/methylation domain-containing protein